MLVGSLCFATAMNSRAASADVACHVDFVTFFLEWSITRQVLNQAWSASVSRHCNHVFVAGRAEAEVEARAVHHFRARPVGMREIGGLLPERAARTCGRGRGALDPEVEGVRQFRHQHAFFEPRLRAHGLVPPRVHGGVAVAVAVADAGAVVVVVVVVVVRGDVGLPKPAIARPRIACGVFREFTHQTMRACSFPCHVLPAQMVKD